MKYMEVSIAEIKESKYNPTIRTDRENPKYRKLRNNIKTNGLIVPIVIGSGMKLVDGHRRLNCLKDLGYEKAPAVINDNITAKNYDKMFVTANEDSMTITTAQECERYLNGALISERTLKCIQYLEEIGGRNFIKRIVSLNNSPVSYHIAINQFKSYTKITNRTMLRKVVYWMLNIGSAYKLKSAIAGFIPANILISAIESRKDIGVDWYKEMS